MIIMDCKATFADIFAGHRSRHCVVLGVLVKDAPVPGVHQNQRRKTRTVGGVPAAEQTKNEFAY